MFWNIFQNLDLGLGDEMATNLLSEDLFMFLDSCF